MNEVNQSNALVCPETLTECVAYTWKSEVINKQNSQTVWLLDEKLEEGIIFKAAKDPLGSCSFTSPTWEIVNRK